MCGSVPDPETGGGFQERVVACAGDHPHVGKVCSKKHVGRTVSSLNYW